MSKTAQEGHARICKWVESLLILHSTPSHNIATATPPHTAPASNISIMADLSTTLPLTRASVIEAHKLVKPHVHLTPVLTNRTLSELASTPRAAEELAGTRWAGRTPARPVLRLWFKCENMQRIGAFKARGAFHAVEKLKREPGWLDGGGKEKGVVTHSSGECLSLFHYLPGLWPCGLTRQHSVRVDQPY